MKTDYKYFTTTKPAWACLSVQQIGGWGNGYVCLPPNHKYFGMHYDDIPIDAHGGLTFADYADRLDWDEIPEGCDGWYIIGFDTMHYNDN